MFRAMFQSDVVAVEAWRPPRFHLIVRINKLSIKGLRVSRAVGHRASGITAWLNACRDTRLSRPVFFIILSLSLSLHACARVTCCLTFACGESRLTNQLFLLNSINATITVYVSRWKPNVVLNEISDVSAQGGLSLREWKYVIS